MIRKYIKHLECIKDYLQKHPKEVFRYSFAALLIATAFSIASLFFMPTRSAPYRTIEVPRLFTKSDQLISREKEKQAAKDRKLAAIVKELQHLKRKEEDEPLTSSEKIRIDYLYNQYQTLQNEPQ